MYRQFDFEIEVSFGNVLVDATAEVVWKNGRWDYEEIKIDSVCDDEGRSVEKILLAVDHSRIYENAAETVERKLDSEWSDDPFADDDRDFQADMRMLAGE